MAARSGADASAANGVALHLPDDDVAGPALVVVTAVAAPEAAGGWLTSLRATSAHVTTTSAASGTPASLDGLDLRLESRVNGPCEHQPARANAR